LGPGGVPPPLVRSQASGRARPRRPLPRLRRALLDRTVLGGRAPDGQPHARASPDRPGGERAGGAPGGRWPSPRLPAAPGARRGPVRRRAKGGRGSGGGLRFACLGSAGAVPSAGRDTTALLVRSGRTSLLIDVGGSPVQKLRRLGVDPVALDAVVVTHTHPDHVYGLPALVQCLLMLGRRAPPPVSCPAAHVGLGRGLLDLFGLLREGLDVPIVGVEARAGARVLDAADLAVTASPNVHGPMPNLAVRVEARGRGLVYSSDTRPCPEVVELARGAAVLV